MKIYFKQPKYVIPALAFLPLIWLGWNIFEMINFEVEEKVVHQTEGAIITDIPDANLPEETKLKSKYQAMLGLYGKIENFPEAEKLSEVPQKQSAEVTKKNAKIDITEEGISTPIIPTRKPNPSISAQKIYRIQILASRNKSAIKNKIHGIEVYRYFHNDLYKFCIGNCLSYKEATYLQCRFKNQFKDSFVVAFKDGKRININK